VDGAALLDTLCYMLHEGWDTYCVFCRAAAAAQSSHHSDDGYQSCNEDDEALQCVKHEHLMISKMVQCSF